MESNEIIKINTIEEYTELFGCPAANHPLISINRLTRYKGVYSYWKPCAT